MRFRAISRGLQLGVALVLASTLVAACGDDDKEASGSDDLMFTVGSLDELYQAAKDNGEDELVFYSILAEAWKPLFDKFTETYPDITIKSEAICCADQYTKLQQEFATKQHTVDVVMAGPQQIDQYADSGWVEFYDASQYDMADIGVLHDGITMANGTGFGIVYNTDGVSEPPTSWDDLLDPQYKGKIALQDLTKVSGTEALYSNLSENGEISGDHMAKLAAQEPKIVASSTEYPQVVGAGEAMIGVGMPISFYQAVKSSGPLGMVFPVEGNADSGQFMAPQATMLSTQAPHPNAGKLFIAWLYTPEGQEAIAARGDYGLVSGSPGPEGFPGIDDLTAMPVPEDQSALDEKYTAEWKPLFG
ncbi:ABC transporter substrate-binding protein [Nocardioides humi]|uniref:Extracellular solute-binding protein n=1 Tax=Nocardioides humi TaxID=449461 RepID=A0ABN2AE34_9ACTN|nr:extracellular solute-binding protein [Nocardioides humi]